MVVRGIPGTRRPVAIASAVAVGTTEKIPEEGSKRTPAVTSLPPCAKTKKSAKKRESTTAALTCSLQLIFLFGFLRSSLFVAQVCRIIINCERGKTNSAGNEKRKVSRK
jgi:hypothetical protein